MRRPAMGQAADSIGFRTVAAGAFLLALLTAQGAWAYQQRDVFSNVSPAAIAVLPLGLLMLASAVTVLVGIRVATTPGLWGLRHALRDPVALGAGVVAVLVYVPLFLWSQNAIQFVDIGPFFEMDTLGVPGFTPIFMVFPVRGAGVVIAAYQIALVTSLSMLLALNAVGLVHLARNTRASLSAAGMGAGGLGLGLLVWCPTCIAPPIMALISTYIVPVLSLAPTMQTFMVTVVYLLSLLLLSIALDGTSRALNGEMTCPLKNLPDTAIESGPPPVSG